MEQPCHAVNTSKDNSCAEGNGGREIARIAIREYGRVKCGRSEGHRIMKSVGHRHIEEGNQDCAD